MGCDLAVARIHADRSRIPVTVQGFLQEVFVFNGPGADDHAFHTSPKQGFNRLKGADPAAGFHGEPGFCGDPADNIQIRGGAVPGAFQVNQMNPGSPLLCNRMRIGDRILGIDRHLIILPLKQTDTLLFI